ncbi:MAG: hypothetical protein K2K17_04455, partial [Lachnospiraceae bacterium]|nr:hypothetical protein [Lachnospiraceae bacterium]
MLKRGAAWKAARKWGKMKNKKHKIFYGMILLLFAVGCGKKEGETISDNMALGNTGGDVIDLTGSVSFNVSADMAGVSSDSISGNLSENVAGEDASVVPESSRGDVGSSISSNDLLAELGVYSN